MAQQPSSPTYHSLGQPNSSQHGPASRPARRVLLIAYLFPPVGGIGAAGSQRALKFAKYLPYYNWQPVVLTVNESSYESYLLLDMTLIEKISSETQIIRTPVFRWLSQALVWKNSIWRKLVGVALPTSRSANAPGRDIALPSRFQRIKDSITDLFEIPDEEMGWLLPAVHAGFWNIKRDRIDAIYATGRPWTALVVGAVLRQLTGKKLIVDFRDPWMTNPFRNHYSHFKNRGETWLEKFVIETADVIIANTAELRNEFLHRFPGESAGKFVTLLNGYDPDDFIFDRTRKDEIEKKHLTITHTGFLYGKRDPKNFLEAVRLAVAKQMIDPSKLRILFVGSIELSYDLASYLRESLLQDIVSLHPHVPYRHSLDYLRQSDVLLLLQPGTTTQIPSKLFDYVGFNKPVLAVSPLRGATCRLISSEKLGHIADPDDIEAICCSLHSLYAAWEDGVLAARSNPDGWSKFDIRQVTGVLVNLLEESACARSRL